MTGSLTVYVSHEVIVRCFVRNRKGSMKTIIMEQVNYIGTYDDQIEKFNKNIMINGERKENQCRRCIYQKSEMGK